MKPLTPKQRECLRDMLPVLSVTPTWYGATTISRLKRDGLIEPVTKSCLRPDGKLSKWTEYRITDAGRAALGGK